MSEKVNHPDHYKTGKYECIEVMKEVFGEEAVKDFCKMNAFKYLWRENRKNGQEDLKKAKWYLDTLLLSELLNPYEEEPEEEPEEEQEENEEGESLIDVLAKGLLFVADMGDNDNEIAKRYAFFQQKVNNAYPERVAYWMSIKDYHPDEDDDLKNDTED